MSEHLSLTPPEEDVVFDLKGTARGAIYNPFTHELYAFAPNSAFLPVQALIT